MLTRISGSLLLVVCFVLPQRLAGAPWSLASCDSSGEPRWQAFERDLRRAKPGSTLYVPKPYPTSDQDVIADYLYQFNRLQHEGKDPAMMAVPYEERVFREIKAEKVSYRVMRFENWTPMRCGVHHRQEFYYLVQAFEVAGGLEITRAVLDNSGTLATWVNMPASAAGPAVEPSARHLLAPTAAMEQINRELGIQGVDPQYVTTYGTVDCLFAFPCLAFRQNGLSYVIYQHGLFEVSLRGPKLIQGKDVGTLDKNQELLPTLTADERLITLGGPAWTIARKASTAQIRHGVSNFH